MKKFLAIALLIVAMLCLCGCSLFGEAAEDDAEQSIASSLQIGVPEDQLKFELQYPGEPGFTESVDLSNTPNYSSQLENPADLLGLEGLDSEGSSDGTAEFVEPEGETEVVEPAPEPSEGTGEEHASAVEPTEETKYPNTGIFLEDD